MAAPKKPTAPAIRVKAKVAHTQPGTQIYRAEGDEFVHRGEVYKHVDKLPDAPKGEGDEGEEEQQ